MKAVGFLKTGGPEELRVVELPKPVAGPHEVVIKMHSIGVNFADIYRRRGEYPTAPPAPYVLGHEGAGIIEEVGAAVAGLKVGNRVAFAHVPRANAEYVRAEAWKVITLPNEVSFDQAAAVFLQGLTAHYLSHDSYRVKPGDQVLIHAASGGVGSLLTQICKHLGARVIGTVSTADKVSAALDAGADEVIVRSRSEWAKKAQALSGGLGVDVAYDAVGATLQETLAVVRVRGTVVYYGWAGGQPPKVDPNILMSDSKSLVGGDLWSHIADRQSLMSRANFILTLIKDKKLQPKIFKTYSLEEAAIAHGQLESGQTKGKILLRPED